MRRAKKSGRWMGRAPIGYVNMVHPDGRKYIMPKPEEAELMQWVFEELARGVLAAEQVRKEANKMGLKCERNNFWKLIRNPMYCGYIIVPAYEDEEAQLAKGLHEPIISKTLFYDVQDVLNGFKRVTSTKVSSLPKLPLRGFLQCTSCHRMLTGSGSRGKCGNRYYYYHCSSPQCKGRFRADRVHDYFRAECLQYRLSPATGELFKMVVMDVFTHSNREEIYERNEISKLMQEQEEMLSNARRKFAKEEMESEDFRIIKKNVPKRYANWRTSWKKYPQGFRV